MKRTSFINVALAGLTALIIASCSTVSPGTSSAKSYPYDTCIVTDNKLGSMGDPVTLVHENQEVKFCCQPCVKKFQANPTKYLSKL